MSWRLVVFVGVGLLAAYVAACVVSLPLLAWLLSDGGPGESV